MKHLIVSCTKKSKYDTLLYNSLDKIETININNRTHKHSERLFIENNTIGLSKNYNAIFSEYKDKYDSIIFIHDDVEIIQLDWLNQVELAYNKYDIVGLAGGLNVEIKAPALWHLMSKQLYGKVGHIDSNNGRRFTTVFGETPHRVCIVDGLFMAFNMKVVKNTKFSFDENFDFHHYDITVGIRANNERLKVGVWPIDVYHQSPGLVNYQDKEYQASQKKFLEIYG